MGQYKYTCLLTHHVAINTFLLSFLLYTNKIKTFKSGFSYVMEILLCICKKAQDIQYRAF